MIRVELYGKVAIVSSVRGPFATRTEAWECVVRINERALYAGRDLRRFDLDRQVHGYGNTPAEAIEHARRTMAQARYERTHPRSWDIGTRWRLSELQRLARMLQADPSLLPCFACKYGHKSGHRCKRGQ